MVSQNWKLTEMISWNKLYWTLFTINVPIPFDKLCVLILGGYYYRKGDKQICAKVAIIFILIATIIFLSFMLNSNRNLLIFYPLLFTFTAIIIGITEKNINIIQTALLPNIYYGIISSIIAICIGSELPGTLALLSKGLPFIFAPMGFSPTLQVYGTLCVAWLLISLELKQKRNINFYIVLFSSILTFNRATWIFLFLLLLIYNRKYAILSIIIGLICIISIDFIHESLLSSSTLESRDDLRVGAEISYWNSNNLIVYLLGRGNYLTTEDIAEKTIWGRQYIENGWDFIFHSYGIIGFIIYTSAIFYFIYIMIRRGYNKFILFIIYYYFVEQILTNEYLTSSISIITSILLILSNANKEIINK